MSGYLSDKKDYYNGKHTQFAINQTVARAGGNEAHINLFTFLITPSFLSLDVRTQKRFAYFDNRAVQSMLFLLEPQMQILLAGVFYFEDLSIRQCLEELQNVYYQTSYCSPSLEEVLSINAAISQLSPGRIFSSALREPMSHIWQERMKFLLCIKSKDDLFHPDDVGIEQRIRRIARVVNTPSPYVNAIVEVAKTNNRINAAIYIGEHLNYSQACIQSLVNVIEPWQLSNT